ncbi:MAG: hypothetical protein WKF30_11390 [Pyrinomonadaceae bacterium]
MAKSGRVVVIGSRGAVEINPRAAMGRDASVLGMMLGNATRQDLEGIHAALVAGLENKTLRPVINRKTPSPKPPARTSCDAIGRSRKDRADS